MTNRHLIRMIVPILGTLALILPASSAMAEGETSTTTETTTTPPPAPAQTSPVPTQTAGETTTTQTTTTPEPTLTTTGPPAPEVKAQTLQARSVGSPRPVHRKKTKSKDLKGAHNQKQSAEEKALALNHKKAPKPSTLTPGLPSSLTGSLSGVPDFFVNSFSIPPFLLPIYQAAGSAYGIPWQVLAAINEVETDYGRDLSVSSAGAEGWMQFMPSEWNQFGVDATAQGYEDPYNPADAIFAAARYLKAAGGDKKIRAAVFSYNHSQAYVDSVMMRAQLLGGTPAGLLGAITGLTEARFPVHAASHFADGFPTLPTDGSGTPQAIPGTIIYSKANAPVIAVQDGVITKIGESATLGKFVSLKDAFGNSYTYAELGHIASLYPVLELRGHSTSALAAEAQAGPAPEPTPQGPATAGEQPRSPLSSTADLPVTALGAASGLQATPGAKAQPTASSASLKAKVAASAKSVHRFRAGPDEVYLHPLRVGVQVIAGTVLGHIAASETGQPEPHMLFQIRPSGQGSPLIDPKPILDGWVELEDTSIFKAKGADPFAQTKPSAGQVLLESKNQLEQQVLRNPDIHIYHCGRGDIQTGQIDRRVLATLEFLAVSGLDPTVSALKCGHAAAGSASSGEYGSGETVDISQINGIPIVGHSGEGSITETTIGRLLKLQGTVRPLQITSPVHHSSAGNILVVHGSYKHIHISFQSLYSSNARFARVVNSVLSPTQWIKLISRLGEIPNPQVANSPSSAAIPDPSNTQGKTSGG